MREVYSKYLNGYSIEDITYYFVWFTEYHKIRENDIEEIIDTMNRVL